MKTPLTAGSVLRIGAALLLCAACFQAGRSYQELKTAAAERPKADPGTEMVAASFVGPVKPAPAPAETSPAAAPGDVAGAGGDIITPLNVRDPSALVMGPSQRSCPPQEVSEPEPKLVDPKPKKMKEGRLLELLKKEGRKSAQPKRF
jgi:hypothetical protein